MRMEIKGTLITKGLDGKDLLASMMSYFLSLSSSELISSIDSVLRVSQGTNFIKLITFRKITKINI